MKQVGNILVLIIRLYQKTLSPDHGWFRVYYPQGYCRFYPSCSQYSIDAIQKYGLFVGPIKGLWRIIRCNPWSKGGVDPA